MKNKYQLAKIACFTGFFLQAIICNINAILFVPLASIYGFTYIHLGTLVAINFISQVSADIIFTGLIDRIGFKTIGIVTGVMSFVGMMLMALTPILFKDVYVGGPSPRRFPLLPADCWRSS